jgi:hypothetical protein
MPWTTVSAALSSSLHSRHFKPLFGSGTATLEKFFGGRNSKVDKSESNPELGDSRALRSARNPGGVRRNGREEKAEQGVDGCSGR